MNVIPFRDPRSRRRPNPPVQPPPALGAAAPPPAGQSPDYAGVPEDRLRMLQNLGALAVVIFIVVFGGWVIDRLRYYSRIQTCIEAGHRNCVPLDIDKLTAR